jgi:hypothetical protein
MEAINAYPTGHAEVINMPSSRFALPVSGRSHIKTAIINDYVFLGGCNLMKAEWVDVMVGWQNSKDSDHLYKIFQNIIKTKHAGKALAWVDRSMPIDVKVTFTHPRHHGLIGGAGQQFSIVRERLRSPRSLFVHQLGRKGPATHAKLLACDKAVMIGSHNYVWAGVHLGTAEIALKSTNEKLAKEAVKTLRRGLKNQKFNQRV